MPLSPTIQKLIDNAWADGHPCWVATWGPDGSNISPKSSLIVFDDQNLAFWERSKKKALENLGHDKRVAIMYSNPQAQVAGLVESGYLRFFGTAELHESGPTRDAIFSRLAKREQEHDGADKGIGVLIRITRAADMRGKSLI